MPKGQPEIPAFERLFAARMRFERFAMLYVHDRTEAEDILMESYAYMWEHRNEIDFSGNVEAYMFNVIKHRCLDYLEHLSVRQKAETNIASDAAWELNTSIATLRAFDPSWLFDTEVRARVRQAVMQLPENTRRIFLMSHVEHKTYAEISQEVGLSVKSVEFHISKALRSLRQLLDDYLPVLGLLLAIYPEKIIA